MASPESGFLVSIVGALGSAITLLMFWRTTASDRAELAAQIAKIEGKADSALQEAAEAKNDHDNLSVAMGTMNREIGDLIGSRSREYGEGLTALRQHVTDHALWARDNFVRKEDFNTAMQEIRKGQSRVEEKLDDLRDRISGKH